VNPYFSSTAARFSFLLLGAPRTSRKYPSQPAFELFLVIRFQAPRNDKAWDLFIMCVHKSLGALDLRGSHHFVHHQPGKTAAQLRQADFAQGLAKKLGVIVRNLSTRVMPHAGGDGPLPD